MTTYSEVEWRDLRIKELEARIRALDIELKYANKHRSLRGARLQILHDWLRQQLCLDHRHANEISLWQKFVETRANDADTWFDRHGVPRICAHNWISDGGKGGDAVIHVVCSHCKANKIIPGTT